MKIKVMKRVLAIVGIATLLLSSCATQQSARGNANCGSKQQKKAKYKSMKSGKSPGGGMLH
jgi:Spy/CpxP family protein refolding chaperone